MTHPNGQKTSSSKHQAPAAGLSELFTLDAAADGIIPVPRYENEPAPHTLWGQPFILSGHESVTIFLGDEKVQKLLSKYGGVYKKDLPRAKLRDLLGRTQQRVDDQHVQEAADVMLSKFLDIPCDITDVPGG